MNQRFADAVGPDEFYVVFAVPNDLPVKLNIHVLVVERVDVPGTHGAIEVAPGCALDRDLDRAAVQDGFVPEVAGGDAEAIGELASHAWSFRPSQTKPRV